MRCALPVVLCLVALPAAAQPAAPLRLTLDEAVARALETSHRLAEGRARQAGAAAQVQVRQSAERPTVSAAAGYTRTNHVEAFGFPQAGGGTRIVYPDAPNNFLTRASFEWPIYTGGRLDALERAAAAEASAAGSDIATTRADLRFEVERSYWALASATEAVRVLTESVARSDAQVLDAQNRLAAGFTAPNEVLTFEAQRAQEQLQLIEARNLHESTMIELRRLIDAAPAAPIEAADSLDAAPRLSDQRDWVAEALKERPERQALLFRISGLEARAAAARAGLRPTVGAGGGVDVANPNAKIFPREERWQTSWDASVNVAWPIFDGGKTKAETAEAEAAIVAAREQLAEFDQVVAADVRQRLLDLASAQAAVATADQGVRSATEARRVVAERFAAGVASNLDVLVAQDALLQADLARTRALASVRLAEARLVRTIGRP